MLALLDHMFYNQVDRTLVLSLCSMDGVFMIVREIPIPGVAKTIPEGFLSIAAICVGTNALGPGFRSVVWVQGCPFHCKGCIAPDWIPFRPAVPYTPGDLAKELLKDPAISGITISGGEPMMQASLLKEMVLEARKIRPINVISYTGFTYTQLVRKPPSPDVALFLKTLDVLIDGLYIENLNDNQGIRGSSNQNIIHLSNRLLGSDLESIRRSTELRFENGKIFIVGVPDPALLNTLDTIVRRNQE